MSFHLFTLHLTHLCLADTCLRVHPVLYEENKILFTSMYQVSENNSPWSPSNWVLDNSTFPMPVIPYFVAKEDKCTGTKSVSLRSQSLHSGRKHLSTVLCYLMAFYLTGGTRKILNNVLDMNHLNLRRDFHFTSCFHLFSPVFC